MLHRALNSRCGSVDGRRAFQTFRATVRTGGEAPSSIVRASPVTLERVEEEALGKAYDSRIMRRLLKYMRPYWRTVAVSLLFMLASSVTQIVGPLLTKL